MDSNKPVEPLPDGAPFFSAKLESDMIEQILKRIDENLALRPLLRIAGEIPDFTFDELDASDVPSLDALPAPRQEMVRLQSLTYLVQGRTAQNILKRWLNLLIRAINRKQILFNRALIETLDLLIEQVRWLRQRAITDESTRQLNETLRQHESHLDQLATQTQDLQAQIVTLGQAQVNQHDRLQDQLAALAAQRQAQHDRLQDQLAALAAQRQTQDDQLQGQLAALAAERQTQHDRLQDLAAAVADDRQMQQALRNQVEGLAGDQNAQRDQLEKVTGAYSEKELHQRELVDKQGQWLELLAANQRGSDNWTRLIQRKLDILSLDVRERLTAEDPPDQLPEPEIVDPERYQARLASMTGRIRVNLGCGEQPLAEYINIDRRRLPEIDVVADARRLPFEAHSLAEIASAHLVEHFREHQFRAVILPYWKTRLQPGGLLRTTCPNWSAMLQRLNSGVMSQSEFKLLTFGAQDYQGDDHFAMYTPSSLTDVFETAGFSRVEVLATDRMNGICPEMELVAYT